MRRTCLIPTGILFVLLIQTSGAGDVLWKGDVPPPAKSSVPFPAERKARTNYHLNMGSGGGFTLIVNGEAHPVESTYSYPLGGEHKFCIKGEPGWAVTVSHRDVNTYTVTGSGPHYKIERTIYLIPDRVEVHDRITALEETGIVVSNRVDTGKKPGKSVVLAGDVDAAGTVSADPWYNRANPTLFIGRENLGLGVVALDDVYRVQCKMTFTDDVASLFTDSFGLPKGASYTLKWALYPSDSGDYFDFINRVRENHGVNGRLVDGGLYFIGRHKTDTIPKNVEKIAGHGIKYLTAGSWYIPLPGNTKHAETLIEGASILSFPEEQKAWEKITRELHKRAPDAKVLFHVEPSINEDPQYKSKYADSRVIDEKGNHQVYPGDASTVFTKARLEKGWGLWNYYATLTNSYLPVLNDAVDLLVGKLKNDGVYFDGLMGQNWAHTYDTWDGVTVRIHPVQKTIERKMATMQLICQAAHLSLARRLTAKGKSVIANGSPGTWTAAREPGIIWFSESPGRGVLHLSPTPISLGAERTRSPAEDIRRVLREGALYFYYYPGDQEKMFTEGAITKQMFPITVQEVRPGCVRGKERIVTLNSGVYGWRNERNLVCVHLYGRDGSPALHGFPGTIDSNGARVKVDLKDSQSAVVKKLPVVLSAVKPVNFAVTRYDGKGLSVALSGEGKADFRMSTGDFPTRQNKKYTITAKGDSPQKVKTTAGKNGELTFSLQLADRLEVTVEPD